VQFETIHPFLDGNGRMGRLLITFMLCAAGLMHEPLLYLSLYLKTHRDRYYELLTAVRKEGDWEARMEFFLTGVRDTSRQAVETAQRIRALFEADAARVHTLGRKSASASRIHQLMQKAPVASLTAIQQTGLSFPTVSDGVGRLVQLGMLKEITGRQRGRLYVYSDYLDILKEGTEPLPRV
jgi:Fic family protein